MHDRNGTPLKLGDTVLVPAIITALSQGEDYCNVTLTSVEGRKPDGAKESYCTNAAVVVLHKSAPPPPADA